MPDEESVRLSRASLAAVLCCVILPVGAQGAAYAPAPGQVFHAGIGGYRDGAIGDFATQSGRHPAVFGYFVSWSAGRADVHWMRGLLDKTHRARSRVAFSVSTKGTGLTPAGIARGDGDAFLLSMNRLLAEHGRPSYLRLLSEMNNADNPYSAYTHSGGSRGPAYTPRQFKRAWRRAILVLRGGEVARIDAALAGQGMPAVRTSATALAQPPVAFMWVPLSFGNPETPRNHPRHWWPGSSWVDWVGTTWYSPHREVRAIDRFIRHPLWNRKPFAFGEYGVRGRESPGFVRLFFDFVARHRRVQMISYYQSAMLEREFRLSAHPRSRGSLRRALRSPRFVGYAPEYD